MNLFSRSICAFCGLMLLAIAAPVTGRAESLAPTKVIAGHPRLLLTPEVLTLIKAKAANDPDWVAIKKRADAMLSYTVLAYSRSGTASNAIYYNYQGFGWLTAFQTLGLAYQVTGNAAYAAKAIELLQAVNAPFAASGSVEPISVDGGYPSRAAAYGIALAYDWFYDKLDAATKQATINTMNAWYDWYKTSAYHANGAAGSNYFGGHMLGFGAIAYASAGDNPRADEIATHMSDLWNTQVVVDFTSPNILAGGYPAESWNYGDANFKYLFGYAKMVQTATGSFPPQAVEFAKRVAMNTIYNLKPNRWQTSDEGDFPGSTTGLLREFVPLYLSDLLAGTTEGQWMQFLRANLGKGPGSSQMGPDVEKFPEYVASRPQLDYRATLPTVFHSIGDEHVFARSDWTDAAVWVSFKPGVSNVKTHEQAAGGHISIQRGNDYLLVNSGHWKGLTGASGSPEASDIASWRTNTLFFDDFGEYTPISYLFVGGQGYYGTNNVLAFDSTRSYVYSKADLTSGYERANRPDPTLRSLRFFFRSFVYLPAGNFVVFDRVKALKTTYTKKLYWHLSPVTAPVLNGNMVTSTVGASSLSLTTLLPASPVIAIEKDGVKSYTDTNMITYRAAVADSATGTDVQFLTAINARDKTKPAPAVSAVKVGSGDMVGALIKDTTPSVVLFSRDGTPRKSVQYAAPYSGTGNHVITDMVTPGTYNVTLDGANAAACAVPASSQGVLSFSSPSSTTGSFSVTFAGLPQTMFKGTGDGQTASVGSVLAPFQVIVKDASNNPVQGVPVFFLVTAGAGTLSAPSAVTDANGVAAVTLTLGQAAGSVTVQANSGCLAGGPIVFTATAAGTASTTAAARIALVSGNGQSGSVGLALPNACVVKITDSNNTAVAGVPATFTVVAGGGTVSAAQVNTDSNGNASALLTLGPNPGPNTVSIASAGLVGSPVTCSATAVGAIAKVSGDKQTGTVGAALLNPLVVKVTGLNGVPISGRLVTFSASGAGTFQPAQAATDGNGLASTIFTPGTTPVTIQANSGSLTGAPITFTATATQASFAFDASLVNSSVSQGGSATINVSIAPPPNATSVSVQLACTGLPAGWGCLTRTNPATASTTMTLLTSATTPAGSYAFQVLGTSAGVAKVVPLTVTLTGLAVSSVTMSATPAAVLMTAGGQPQTVMVNLTRACSGSAGTTCVQAANPVTLSTSALPPGVTANITQPGTGNSAAIVLSVNPHASATATQLVTVTGQATGTSTASARFTVRVGSPPSLGIAISPSSVVVAPGGPAQKAAVTVMASDYTGPVELAISGLPAGVTAQITQPQWGSMGTIELSASSTAKAATGTRVTVSASGTGVTNATATLALDVRAGACILSVCPADDYFDANGGSGSLSVVTIPGCAWKASSNAPFLSLTGASSGSGNGTVSYSVNANSTGAGRTAAITFGGASYTLTQSESVANNTQTSIAAATASGPAGGIAIVPIVVGVVNGSSLDSVAATAQLRRDGAAPDLTGNVEFQPADNAPALVSLDKSIPGQLTLKWRTPCASMRNNVTLGYLVVPIPVTASVGHTYTVHLAAPSAGLGPQLQGIIAGPDVKVTVAADQFRTISAKGVVNSAAYTPDLSPGGIGSAFSAFRGVDLAGFTDLATKAPLPTTLGSTKLMLNGIPTPLFFAAPSQINFQIPWELANKTSARAVLVTGGVSSNAVTLPILTAAPGLYSMDGSGAGQGAILIATTGELAAPNGAFGIAGRPARGGEYLSIYCTGLGAVTNPPPNGTPASLVTLSHAVAPPVVTVGGQQAAVTFAGLAPGFIGLYQVNVRLPNSVTPGPAVPVIVTSAGRTSNTVTIALQ